MSNTLQEFLPEFRVSAFTTPEHDGRPYLVPTFEKTADMVDLRLVIVIIDFDPELDGFHLLVTRTLAGFFLLLLQFVAVLAVIQHLGHRRLRRFSDQHEVELFLSRTAERFLGIDDALLRSVRTDQTNLPDPYLLVDFQVFRYGLHLQNIMPSSIQRTTLAKKRARINGALPIKQRSEARSWGMTILTSVEQIRNVLTQNRVIAVLGANVREEKPAYYVPRYLEGAGYEVHPVNPVYTGRTLFGREVKTKLPDLDVAVDIVNVFRRSQDLPAHVDEILAMNPRPKVVWFQLGIQNNEVAQSLSDAGIDVVQNRCILVDHQRLI
jgi:predicted CoA-binding protein